MSEPEAFSHVAVPADLFRAVHAYLGQRPAAETARLLLALEASPACNIGLPAAAEIDRAEDPPEAAEAK